MRRASVKEITSWFADRHGQDYEKKITTKWVGWLIRKKLGLKTHKSHGAFLIPLAETTKLTRLYERYGLGSAEGEGAEIGAAAPNPPSGGREESSGDLRVDFGF